MAANRSPSGRKPVVRVRPRRRLCTSARQRWAIGVHARGVPRLAEERHDLAMAILPCPVECRLVAVDGIGSKRRIGAPFEEALGDREVAVACRPMQCCLIVVALKTNERPTRNDYMEADPSHVLGEGMLEAYLGIDLDGLSLEEEADAPFLPEV